jgi:hypothetical protein
MLRKNSGEAPDFMKGIVERSRRNADDIRLAEIAFHIRSEQLLVQMLWVFVR